MNIRIVSGVTHEVPDLVRFIEKETSDLAPEFALYVGFYSLFEPSELLSCLVFYSPSQEHGLRGIKFGGAVYPGRPWGRTMEGLICMRFVVEGMVREELGLDILEADIPQRNFRVAALLVHAGFKRMNSNTYRYTFHAKN